MKKLPNSINIAGITYELLEIEDPIKVAPSLKCDCDGCISFQDQQIRIFKNLSNEKKTLTLLHEITHGCIEAMCLDIEEEENFVIRFSTILSDTLTRNNLLK